MKDESIHAKRLINSLPDSINNISGKFGNTNLIALLCAVLVVIIMTVYMQTGNHQFLNLDDDVYVTNNPHVAGGLTGKNIIWAITSVDEANWHPLTWLSHMTDVQLYGMDPRGHHLTNVAIHTASTLLLFFLLFRMSNTIWPSLFVAALFALHPLHVESVAWVAERKDVLSALFWFLTLILYSEYAAKPRPVLYIFTLFSFVLGLMSKQMLITLPMVMLLIDIWPLGRFRNSEQEQGLRKFSEKMTVLVIEKLPFFICSLFSGLFTIYAQQKGGAIATLSVIPFRLRIENALIAYVKYIGKTLWPSNLAVYYPFPPYIPLWHVISTLFLLLFLTAAAVRLWRRYPYFTTGWFWFLITLMPVIGLLQVGSQSMADRYTYIPATGLFIIATWGALDLTKNLRHRQGILSLLAGAVMMASTAITWQQLGYWQDNVSLYRHTLQVTTDNKKIHYNLGRALADKGDLDAAILEFREITRISPNEADAYYNLGVALANKGDLDSAILEYRKALGLNPNDADTHKNIRRALARKRLQNYPVK